MPSTLTAKQQQEQDNRDELKEKHNHLSQAAHARHMSIFHKKKYDFIRINDRTAAQIKDEIAQLRNAAKGPSPSANGSSGGLVMERYKEIEFLPYGMYKTAPAGHELLDYYKHPQTGAQTVEPIFNTKTNPFTAYSRIKSAYSKTIDFLAMQGSASIMPTWDAPQNVNMAQLRIIWNIAKKRTPPMIFKLSPAVRGRLAGNPRALQKWMDRAAQSLQAYNKYMAEHGYDANVEKAKQYTSETHDLNQKNPVPDSAEERANWVKEKQQELNDKVESSGSLEEKAEVLREAEADLEEREQNLQRLERELESDMSVAETALADKDPAAVQQLIFSGEAGHALNDVVAALEKERASIDQMREIVSDKTDEVLEAAEKVVAEEEKKESELEEKPEAAPEDDVKVEVEGKKEIPAEDKITPESKDDIKEGVENVTKVDLANMDSATADAELDAMLADLPDVKVDPASDEGVKKTPEEIEKETKEAQEILAKQKEEIAPEKVEARADELALNRAKVESAGEAVKDALQAMGDSLDAKDSKPSAPKEESSAEAAKNALQQLRDDIAARKEASGKDKTAIDKIKLDVEKNQKTALDIREDQTYSGPPLK